MKKFLFCILIIITSINVFAQTSKSKKKTEAGNQQPTKDEPTLEETVNWLNEKFKTSIVSAFSYEKKCLHSFDLKVNSTEITATKRHNCDGVNYEITYIIPFKSLDSLNASENGKGPLSISHLTLTFKCSGGNSCINRQYKDYAANTTKTTYISFFDIYDINAKCTNPLIKERIVNAINHAIHLNGGGKLNEKF